MNNFIHLISQPQPGIGKSYIAYIFKQYLKSKVPLKTYSIEKLNISLWDKIFDLFFNQERQNFIIDVDSAFYEPFKQYLAETNILNSISSDSKNEIIHHNIFTPGRNGERTRDTLDYISGQVKKRVGQTIVWENQNCGITLKQQTKGQFSRLSELPEFKHIKDDINSIIHLPAEAVCFQKDLSSHILSGQTFDQAIYKSGNNLIYRQRLYKIKKRTFEAIENGNVRFRTTNN